MLLHALQAGLEAARAEADAAQRQLAEWRTEAAEAKESGAAEEARGQSEAAGRAEAAAAAAEQQLVLVLSTRSELEVRVCVPTRLSAQRGTNPSPRSCRAL